MEALGQQVQRSVYEAMLSEDAHEAVLKRFSTLQLASGTILVPPAPAPGFVMLGKHWRFGLEKLSGSDSAQKLRVTLRCEDCTQCVSGPFGVPSRPVAPPPLCVLAATVSLRTGNRCIAEAKRAPFAFTGSEGLSVDTDADAGAVAAGLEDDTLVLRAQLFERLGVPRGSRIAVLMIGTPAVQYARAVVRDPPTIVFN
eukprot:m51a1_g402 hypothetical protein (198) ;mRNA; r:723813-724623